MRLIATLKPALGIQLAQSDAKTYSVTAADTAVDDHSSDPGMVRAAS
jgi:hypothetical protein